MRKLVRRTVTGCVVATTSLALIGAASAAGAKHATDLTKGKSAVADAIDVLAGSSTAVVYATGPTWKRGPSGTLKLLAANARGKVRHLALPKGQDVQSLFKWSLVGNQLVALENDGQTVAWWNVSGAKHGTKKLALNTFLLSASKDGWLIANDSTGVVSDVKAGGKTKTLGAPFAKSTSKGVSYAVSGDTGVALFGSAGGISYLKWGSKKFSPVKFDTSVNQLYSCTSVAASAIGCYGSRNGAFFVARIPVKGKAVLSRVPKKFGQPASVALSRTATTFIDQTNEHFFGTKAKGGKVKVSKHVTRPAGYPYRGTAVSALGKIAVATGPAKKFKLAIVKNAKSHPKTLVGAARGALHAATIALDSKRVAYTDDKKSYNAGDIWARTLSGGASAGKAKQLLVGGSATSYGLSISGTTVAASEYVAAGKIKFKPVVAVVSGKKKSQVAGSQGQASGSSVIFRDPHNHVKVFNAKTKKATSLGLPADTQSEYLNGGTVDYIRADGSVWVRALAPSSTPVMIDTATASSPYDSRISASGGAIAWERFTSSGNDEVRYCVVSGSSCPVQSAGTTNTLIAATTDGVLMYGETDNASGVTLTWNLRGYSGSATQQVLKQGYSFSQFSGVASTNSVYNQVAVAAGRIAWIDPGGSAHIAKL